MKNNVFPELETCLENLGTLPMVRVNQNAFLSKRISALQDKLQNKTFQLVILGQFKRGKTSLINALFGEELLPTAIVPLTSIITILKYGTSEKITVSFLNGKKKAIQRHELAEYITESKNSNNEKGVEQVIFEYPSEFLKEGVQIIDTPGVGSVYKHNTDMAYEFVPRADAGIFVVTADPPISDAELQFLKSIKYYLAKIVFVQNKIDQVSEKERTESLEFTKHVIEEAVEKADLHFFQLSAKLGIEGKKEKNRKKLEQSNIKFLEENIQTVFIQKKEHILILSVAYKVLPILAEIELQLQIEKKALQLTIQEMKEKAEIFEKEAEKIKQEKEDDNYILQGQAERLTKQVLIDDIEVLKEQELSKLLELFEEFLQQHQQTDGKELVQQFDIFLETSIKTIFTAWRKEEEARLQKALQSVLTRFSDQTNQYIKHIVDTSVSLFQLKLHSFQVNTTLADEVEFRFSFDEYEVDLELFTPIVSRLPRFLSHKLLYNKMKEDVLREFDRHCGKSRYDFHERIMKRLYEYMGTLDESLEQTIQGIEHALSKAVMEKTEKEECQQKARIDIERQEETIIGIRNTIEEITHCEKG